MRERQDAKYYLLQHMQVLGCSKKKRYLQQQQRKRDCCLRKYTHIYTYASAHALANRHIYCMTALLYVPQTVSQISMCMYCKHFSNINIDATRCVSKHCSILHSPSYRMQARLRRLVAAHAQPLLIFGIYGTLICRAHTNVCYYHKKEEPSCRQLMKIQMKLLKCNNKHTQTRACAMSCRRQKCKRVV